jgi:hypothetical protein
VLLGVHLDLRFARRDLTLLDQLTALHVKGALEFLPRAFPVCTPLRYAIYPWIVTVIQE